MTQAVIIKSKPYGIHLVLSPKLEFSELISAVLEKFQEAAAFFQDARVGISFEGFPLTNDQEYRLIAEIEEHTSIHIVCIMEQEQIREACVLHKVDAMVHDRIMESALYHKGSLKPGEHVHSDTGLVVMGNVPKTAKVTAAGNIVIYGTLEGFAQAGTCGDSAATIAALSIDTGKLQIGNILLVPPEKGGRTGFWHKRKKQSDKGKKQEELIPQIARVQDGHVIMESYQYFSCE